MELKVQYLADVPKLSLDQGNAGIDLRASGTWVVDIEISPREIHKDLYVIEPGERILIKTGVALEIPAGNWGNIRDRSGLAMKRGLHTLAGVVDASYRGEIGVIVINLGSKPIKLTKHERIAQMIIAPYVHPTFVEANLSETERGAGGFGSSGTH